MASDISSSLVDTQAPTRRARIIEAAFALFREHGYAGTSTLAIATHAKLSKRDLYAEFAGKRDILAACIDSRAAEFRAPLALPPPKNRRELIEILVRFGAALRLGVAAPPVIATFRLAIQEAQIAPDVAQALNASGRDASLRATIAFMRDAQSRGLLGPAAAEQIAGEFLNLALGDHILQNLLALAPAETPDHAAQQARRAAEAILILHPPARPKAARRSGPTP